MNPKIKKTKKGIFVLKEDTHLSRWVERDGRLDHARDYIARFKHLIPFGGSVIDCGTSIGDHTVTYAQLVGPAGCVLGFEANPVAAECASLNLEKYPWAKIYNVGLAESVGSASLNILENVGASFITQGHGVELAPLDAYTGELFQCNFIKMDVEGFEPRVLDGAIASITRFKPAMVVEIHSHALSKQGFNPDSVFSRLEKLGYRWSIADGTPDAEHYDILALPR